jgi:hypothetical protein
LIVGGLMSGADFHCVDSVAMSAGGGSTGCANAQDVKSDRMRRLWVIM